MVNFYKKSNVKILFIKQNNIYGEMENKYNKGGYKRKKRKIEIKEMERKFKSKLGC